MIDTNLIDAIAASWSADTASPPEAWTTANPSKGHCDVTSLVVREIVGGDLKLAQVFRNGGLSEHHYWNVLPDGEELDLTKAQFDGDETFGDPTMMDAEFFASAGPMNPALVARLDAFRAEVDKNLVSRP